MRNLKRALSLALAAVMVIGMMVVGAGAVSFNDFTDKDEIENADAVSMVTELGIINGLPSGNFGPTQNIDRASFVKMVALAYNGGKEPMLPSGAKVSYVDTAGTWASSYIEYCTNLGFVAGDGTTGKFNPTTSVTVSQAAKMLLVALGYNADIEKYVGYDWQINTDAGANTAGLYDGLSGDTSAALTRDNAAQMIYNALNATMVKYEGVYDLTSGTMKPQLTNKDMKTLLEEKFGAIKVEGVVTANEYAGLGDKNCNASSDAALDEGKTSIHVTDADATMGCGTYKVSSTLDMLGKTVTMFVKPGKNSTDPAKATVLGSVIVSDSNKVVTTTASKTTAKLETLLKDNKLSVNGKTQYSVNYAPTELNKLIANPAGAEYTFIDNNDDGKVDFAIQFVQTFGKVSSYNDKGDGSISVKLLNNDSTKTYMTSFSSSDAIEDVVGFEDVKKDDYVLCYVLGDPDDGVMHIEKAEYIEGTLTSIRGGKAVVDGTTYEQSGLVKGVSADVDNQDLATTLADSIGETVVFYLDAAGNVALVTDAATSTDYLYVLESDTYKSFSDSIQAKVVLADGTKATVDVDPDSVTLITTDDGKEIAKGAYSYTKNSKDVYKLTAVASDKQETVTEIEKGTAGLTGGAAVANSKTIFVLANSTGKTFSVYTGINNVPDAKITGTGVAVVDKNNVAKVVFATKSDLSGDSKSIYVLNEKPVITVDKNGDKVYTYDVIYDGNKTTLTGDSSNLFPNTGLWKNIEVSNGAITSTSGKTELAAAPATKAGSDLVANGGITYTYNSKTVFLVVDDLDVSEGSVDSINIDDVNAKNTDNIIIVADKDNANLAAYVYIVK